MNNSLQLHFITEDLKDHFNFQCAVASLIKLQNKLCCFFEKENYQKKRNNFIFSFFLSLGMDNLFAINSGIDGFYYHGYDFIFNGLNGAPNLFVSGKGSKIILNFDKKDADKDYLPQIYANLNAITPLSDCKRKILPNDK